MVLDSQSPFTKRDILLRILLNKKLERADLDYLRLIYVTGRAQP